MASAQQPQTQRQRLGAELRRLRNLAGLSGREMAARVGVSQSKISRIENGDAAPSLPETTAWAKAADASADTLQHLAVLTEAAFTEVVPWHTALAGDQPHLQEQIQHLESQAGTIRNFQPSIVPGLLQTAEYARRIIQLADTTGQQDYAAAVAARLQRQQALYQPDRTFQFVLTENALRLRLGPPHLHLAQLDHLRSINTLENVSISVLPSDRPAAALAWHNFVIYDDLANDAEPFVRFEAFHAAVTVNDPRDVAIYRSRLTQFEEGALHSDAVPPFLDQLARDLRRAD